MAKFLITPSLYNSYLWYADTDFNAIWEDPEKAEEAEKAAYQDWLNCLNKVKTPTTEAQQKGINFENAVEEMSNNLDKVRFDGEEVVFANEADFILTSILDKSEQKAAYEVAKIVGKGLWQQTLMKETDNYLLYGRSDHIAGNMINDIKRTGSYEAGKYLKSIQHQIYFEGAENIEHFRYVIAAGKTNPSVFVEYYHKEPNNLENLLGKVDLMVDFIKSVPEFYAPFKANWIAKGE